MLEIFINVKNISHIYNLAFCSIFGTKYNVLMLLTSSRTNKIVFFDVTMFFVTIYNVIKFIRFLIELMGLLRAGLISF